MPLGFTFAYQPVVDVSTRMIHSYEALVRGPNEEPADWVIGQYDAGSLSSFDMLAATRAIRLAAQLGLHGHININLLADTMSERRGDSGSATIVSIAEMAKSVGMRPDQLVVELTESETISNFTGFLERTRLGRSLGLKFAIDDFGSGYSGLNLLAEFQPDFVKLDMVLVREIERLGPRQAIVRGVQRTCEDLGIDIVAEGVETVDEYHWLRDEGITMFQGFLFARPGFETLPSVHFPD